MKTCPECQGSGHRPEAPWLLCSLDCEAATRIRERSGLSQRGSISTRPPPTPPGTIEHWDVLGDP